MTRHVTVLFWIAIGCGIFATSLAAVAWALYGPELWAVIVGG